MRRWATVTALLAIFYGFGFLTHEQPPTGGHALAGLSILGLAICLLSTIGWLSRDRSRSSASWLLGFQALTTAAAIIAVFLQQIPVAPKLIGTITFAVPLVASSRHYRPETWTPKPITDRTLMTDLVVEVSIVCGAIGLMVWLHSFGLILWVISGSVNIAALVYSLRMMRSLERIAPDQRSA